MIRTAPVVRSARELAPGEITPSLALFLDLVWTHRTRILGSARPEDAVYRLYSRQPNQPRLEHLPGEVNDLEGRRLTLGFLEGLSTLPRVAEQVGNQIFMYNYAHTKELCFQGDATRDSYEWIALKGKQFYHVSSAHPSPDAGSKWRLYLNVRARFRLQLTLFLHEEFLVRGRARMGQFKTAGPLADRADSVVIWVADQAAVVEVLRRLAEYQNAEGNAPCFGDELPRMVYQPGSVGEAVDRFGREAVSLRTARRDLRVLDDADGSGAGALRGVGVAKEPEGGKAVVTDLAQGPRIQPGLGGQASYGSFRVPAFVYALKSARNVDPGLTHEGKRVFVEMAIEALRLLGLDPRTIAVLPPAR